MKKLALIIALLFITFCLCACSNLEEPAPALAVETSPPQETEYVPSPEEIAAKEELERQGRELVSKAQSLVSQYYYDEALELLKTSGNEAECVKNEINNIEKQKNELVDFTEDIPHIFFHSLIVYPEMIFFDRETPMGGYNSGFSEKQELEKMLPQLYERGYVLYDLDKLWTKKDGVMQRERIMLPPGKTPLILSVDDVAYAYGDGYAQKLFLDDDGQLIYAVNNPQGTVDFMPDGDVMGVVDAFVKEHPDFAYKGHKGTIALTGFQGAFGYSYDIPEEAEQMRGVVEALKADGWNFASHSYTHNSVNNFYGPGCSEEKISYDINKWVDRCVPCLGETRLFIAPFGYRVQQPMLQHILDKGFDIYCTVDDEVYNEVNPDYALMSRIEIGGYSMTYWPDMLGELFFDVETVFDYNRPPVIA